MKAAAEAVVAIEDGENVGDVRDVVQGPGRRANSSATNVVGAARSPSPNPSPNQSTATRSAAVARVFAAFLGCTALPSGMSLESDPSLKPLQREGQKVARYICLCVTHKSQCISIFVHNLKKR